MSKIISITQYETELHGKPAIDIVITHELDATLGEVSVAHDEYFNASDLRIVAQANVRYLAGDPDYGTTYSVFTHYSIRDKG
jgi:hypothetical protein